MAVEAVNYHGVGRRKTAVARVYIRPGTGKVKINGKEYEDPVAYFNTQSWVRHAFEPLKVTGTQGQFDIVINVSGGGLSGQAGAVRLGLAKALVAYSEDYRKVLKDHGMLTRDARVVERKKYGLRKARRAPQFSKR